MQREKLYNLHKIPYFTVAFICFEKRQNSERSNFDLAKKCFFRMRWTRFFLIQHLICCVSKRTKYTTGCRVKNSTICNGQFVLLAIKNKQTSKRPISSTAKILPERGPRFFVFHLFLTQYVLFQRNRIWRRMQREKLYKLQTTVYLNAFWKKAKFSEPLFTESRIGRSEYCLFRSETCTINISFTL